jgi:uncharacterized protein (DUF1015 family)
MRVRAFRGYRYAIGGEREVSKVVAPPYDQISPQQQELLYALSPANIVRVSYPREPGDRKYSAARETLARWTADAVWAPEERAAIYPYHQTYVVDGHEVTRVGLLALGQVTEYARGEVLPHERTHAGPKEDRMRLLEATGVDTGVLFMLVSDPERELLALCTSRSEPIAEARDLKGERHRLWRVDDAATVTRSRSVKSESAYAAPRRRSAWCSARSAS